MTNTSWQMALLLIAGSGAGFCGTAAGAETNSTFTLTSGLDYSSGKYGESDKTEIVSVPIVAKYETGSWTLKLTVPYVTIHGPGNVVPSIGPVDGALAPRKRTTESGMGDVVTAVTYNLFDGASGSPVVDVTGKIKFATADADKGLGTGENDYATQVDIYQGFGKFTAIGTLGYRVYGNTKFGALDNVFYGSLGGSYKLTEKTSAGAIYDYRPRITSRGSQVSEITTFVTHKISPHWKAQGYLVGGMADGSPDYGGGGLVSYAF